MNQLTEQIPGLAQAIEQEQLVRNAAFLNLKERLCGFDVNPLTLRHVMLLESIGSPFVCGGRPMPHDFGAFLVVVTGAKGFRRWNLLRRLGRVKYEIAFNEIMEFIRESMQDGPGRTSEVEGISYFSFGASIVDKFAKEYQWTEASVLDLPLKRLFQYQKIISRRNGEEVLFNPSDKVRGEWLAQQHRN